MVSTDLGCEVRYAHDGRLIVAQQRNDAMGQSRTYDTADRRMAVTRSESVRAGPKWLPLLK
jgi:hypothetical protein